MSGVANQVAVDGRALNTSFVLVVDDDASLHELLRRALREHGFSSAHVRTTADAILVAQRQDVNAVILDLGLAPDDTGLNFLVWLRVQPWYVDLPVVVLTGRPFVPKDEQDLIRRHRARLLQKPQPIGELMATLTDLVERRV